MKTTCSTPRLPAGDPPTQCSEAAVFASLGLVAVLTISFALLEMTRFVAGSPSIATALTRAPRTVAVIAPATAPNAVTNLVQPHNDRVAARPTPPNKA